MTREELLRQQIDGFRRKIETYQAFIAELEQQLGIGASTGAPSPPGAQGKPSINGSGDPLAAISGMIFFNKSQPEAAKAFLEMANYPLTTAQIMAGIEKGGVKVGGKTELAKKQNLYTILNRSAEFGRVKRDTWGLIGWPGVSKKVADDEGADAAGKAEGEPKPKA